VNFWGFIAFLWIFGLLIWILSSKFIFLLTALFNAKQNLIEASKLKIWTQNHKFWISKNDNQYLTQWLTPKNPKKFNFIDGTKIKSIWFHNFPFKLIADLIRLQYNCRLELTRCEQIRITAISHKFSNYCRNQIMQIFFN